MMKHIEHVNKGLVCFAQAFCSLYIGTGINKVIISNAKYDKGACVS